MSKQEIAGQVIRAAFLAPDLVEAVLQGRAPAQLTLAQIMKRLPYDWNEQRSLLGLAPGAIVSLRVCDGAASSQ
jgi:hypothetical protein